MDMCNHPKYIPWMLSKDVTVQPSQEWCDSLSDLSASLKTLRLAGTDQAQPSRAEITSIEEKIISLVRTRIKQLNDAGFKEQDPGIQAIDEAAALGLDCKQIFADFYYTNRQHSFGLFNHFASWNISATARTLARLETRLLTFTQNPTPGILTPSLEERQRKYDCLSFLLKKDEEQRLNLRDKSSLRKTGLDKIIGGLLCEFTQQTLEQRVAVNVLHDRNPPAKAYWESLNPECLTRAIDRGVFHIAVSYLNLFQKYGAEYARMVAAPDARKVRAPFFHAIGEIIRASIDTFREESYFLLPDLTPCPSIYNDHLQVLRLALQLTSNP